MRDGLKSIQVGEGQSIKKIFNTRVTRIWYNPQWLLVMLKTNNIQVIESKRLGRGISINWCDLTTETGYTKTQVFKYFHYQLVHMSLFHQSLHFKFPHDIGLWLSSWFIFSSAPTARLWIIKLSVSFSWFSMGRFCAISVIFSPSDSILRGLLFLKWGVNRPSPPVYFERWSQHSLEVPATVEPL